MQHERCIFQSWSNDILMQQHFNVLQALRSMHFLNWTKILKPPVLPKLPFCSLYMTGAVYCIIQLTFCCSPPSGPGNGGDLGSQAPLTLCNLRTHPCAGSSEVERSGISLAGLLHITMKETSYKVKVIFLPLPNRFLIQSVFWTSSPSSFSL